jgi:DNA repair exonuclease SbcCD ATPase subunit
MITKLDIYNFQSHKHTQLDLDKGVNIIIGPTDSGKSAVIRALLWAITNRPSGESFRSHFSDNPTRVIATLTDGVIERSKSNKTNVYMRDEKLLEAFGQDVPEPIASLWRLTDINIQRQFDQPFLLSQSASDISRKLNEVTNLDKIDTSITYILQRVREIDQDIKLTQLEIARQEQELKQYDWLPAAKRDMDQLRGLSDKMGKTESRYRLLTTLLETLSMYKQKIDSLFYVDPTEHMISQLTDLSEKVQRLRNSRVALLSLGNHIRLAKIKVDELAHLLSMETEVTHLTKLITTLQGKKEKVALIRGLLEEITQYRSVIMLNSEVIKQAETEYHRKMPKSCPLCGRSS